MQAINISVQLYSVRDFCKTPEQTAQSLAKLAKIGYRYVEAAGWCQGLDVSSFGKLVAEAGLKISSAHTGWNRFLTDLDTVIAEYKVFNCTHTATGGLPAEYFSLDGLKRFVGEIGPVAAKLAAAGMDFSYHNHSHELVRYGDKTWLAAMYEQAGPKVVKAEIDTFWIAAGGGDPAWWVRHSAGRAPLLHVKDMIVLADHTQRFAEVGEGNLNWSAIIKAAADSGVQFAVVEQDNCYDRDPFDSLAISFRNLKAMGLS